MPEPRIIYIAGFNVRKNTGRNKATREKAAALQQLLAPGQFLFFYPQYSSSRLLAYLKVVWFDIRMFFRLCFVDKNARIIQRTTFLPITNTWLRLLGRRIIYELHTDLQDEIRHYHVGRLEKLVLHAYVYCEKLNLRASRAIIYNHAVLKRIMSKKYARPSIYTYNGSNTIDFYPEDMMACRQQLGLSPGLRYYIFVGSLARWRGVDLLIDIFRDRMSANDVLLIIGNASHEYGRALRKQAAGAPAIIFKDEMDVGLLNRYINAANLCLVPVKAILTSPGNPLKLYDYIACGKPVVGQEDVTGCADEIVRYGLGMITDFYDAARAARELKDFCIRHDPGHFLENNRRVAEEEVSWKNRMEKWLAFILQQ